MRSLLCWCGLLSLLPAVESMPVPPTATSIAIWNGLLVVTAADGGRPDLRPLRQKIDVAWDDATIDQAVDHLRQHTNLNLVVVPPTGERRVTLRADAMPLGQVLGWVEKLSGAAISAVDGAIAFSETPIAGKPTTRLYEVRDLLPLISNAADPRQQEAEFVDVVQRLMGQRPAEQVVPPGQRLDAAVAR